MSENKIYKLKIGERDLIIAPNDLAEQSDGSIFVRYGDTMVMANCVMGKKDSSNMGFFPLTVEYEEKYYAAGKIKGSRFMKRENRPSDEAICNGRLIDRAIRPRFPKNLNREVQVINTVLSWDAENDPDVLGLIASSQALSISNIPWSGPVSAVRVCKKDGQYILNPTYLQREGCELDIVFAAVLDGKDILVNMIESDAEETGEKSILEAFDFAEKSLREIIAFQSEIQKEIGKEKTEIPQNENYAKLQSEVAGFLYKKLEKAIFQEDKAQRGGDMDQLKNDLVVFIEEKFPGMGLSMLGQSLFDEEVDKIVHENAIKHSKRADGRKLDELRKISSLVALLPRTHGSGVFMRGQTKALSILTLGAPGDQQLLEGMEITGKKRFMLHYNFPPYSSGEIKPMRGPGRREIGHGMLAEKALLPLIPNAEQFPYTIRIVTEILSSNGSTSMASVSSGSLALMDAGVPIKRPATGIAIGLMQDQKTKEYVVLTDIQGPEDHHGDMDFKVAGTSQGITAVQLDVKIAGISREIMEKALAQAQKARMQILEVMQKTIPAPRPELSPFAPRIMTIQIDPEKIREVIGSGGKVINEIIAKTGAAIDIQDTGVIFVTAEKEESAQKAVEWIKNIVRVVAVGETFTGVVKRILEFGAFVEILPGQDGMIHISKLANYRVKKVEDIVNIGDTVSVKVIEVDEQGRINLALIANESKNK